ncbi:hypothetical protein F5882DRAFT_364589 [Hyaloscypha sp. PMI_1271]|nr:hypothetical protein F5882DRAFT_364589 [Hyaloscypha sp. PMI_1271]
MRNNTDKTYAATTIFADGWVDEPNGRGTIGILWACFFTIFVATYTVLHLNLPARNESRIRVLIRKTKWMTIAVVVPEVLTASAFAQYTAARDSMATMVALGHDKWTMRHAFFLNMGGVWLRPRDSDPFPINATQLLYLVKGKHIDLPSLTEEEIWDRSKADSFAKTFACFQIGWLVLQCLGRAVQKLPITPLEIGTIELIQRICPQRSSWRETPLDFISTINSPSFTSELILKTPNWPSRKSFLGPSTRIRNDVFGLKYRILDQVFVGAIWIGYAGVHLLAWSFDFPTRVEQILWQVACLTMAGSMVVFWTFSNRRFYQLVAYVWPWKRLELEKVVAERQRVSTIQIMLGAFVFLAYLSARLCLIVQVFITLRKMPLGVFETVNWVAFLPHV